LYQLCVGQVVVKLRILLYAFQKIIYYIVITCIFTGKMIWGREREDWKEKMRLRNEESMRMAGWEGIGEPGRGRSKLENQGR
jgi:hypothetical protein